MTKKNENYSVKELSAKLDTAWKDITEPGGIVESTHGDLEKFQKGNQAAGTRVRKNLQTIKNMSQEMRAWVQSIKNADKK